MGFDVQSIRFIKYCHKRQELGKTVTIGRQEIDPLACKMIYKKNLLRDNKGSRYCEEVLVKNIGASSVDSIDISGYEKANILHDMNQPLPEELWNGWDTVIDGGSLEHIYHFPQAMDNCSRLCRLGGQIIHFVPGNNFLNHGFYQFSPDLFYEFYSTQNGYENTEVFITEVGGCGRCYKVSPPSGERRELMSKRRILLMVCTRLRKKSDGIKIVYQKDYQISWAGAPSPESWLKKEIKRCPILHKPVRLLLASVRDRIRRIGPGNKSLKQVRI